jgi:hypothetical protein
MHECVTDLARSMGLVEDGKFGHVFDSVTSCLEWARCIPAGLQPATARFVRDSLPNDSCKNLVTTLLAKSKSVRAPLPFDN